MPKIEYAIRSLRVSYLLMVAACLIGGGLLYYLHVAQTPIPGMDPSEFAKMTQSATDYALWMALFLVFAATSSVAIGELMIRSLRKESFWGWVVAFCFFVACTTSIFLPMALFGFYGLFHKESREVFLGK